jgi:hypothetical protein
MDKVPKSIEFRDVLSTFLIVVIAVVVVFGVQLLLQVQDHLTGLRAEVRSLQTQLVTQRKAEPFRVLQDNCTQCHSERRFTKPHSDSELMNIIQRMDDLPDFEISAKDKDVVHGALETLKCVRCHEDEALKKVINMDSERQREIVERMRKQPDSDITREAAADILKSMQQIQGY